MPSTKETLGLGESSAQRPQYDVVNLQQGRESHAFGDPQDLSDGTSTIRAAFGHSLGNGQINGGALPREQQVSESPQERRPSSQSFQQETSPSRHLIPTTFPEGSATISHSESPENPKTTLVGRSQEAHIFPPAAEIPEKDIETDEDPSTTVSQAHENLIRGLEDASACREDTSLPAATVQEQTSEGPVTARSSTIRRTKSAPPKPASKLEDEECPICQTPYTSRSTLQPCGHVFDFRCMMTWLEEVFRSKYDTAELNCPLCRSRVHQILEDGTLQPFDVGHHFRKLARREGRSRPLPGTMDELLHYFIRGGSGASNAGPSTLHPWQRESITLLSPRQQFQNDPWHATAQHQARVGLVEQLRLLQELEDMGEGASTDLDDMYGRVNRLGRVERDHLQHSPHPCPHHHHSHQMSQRPNGTTRSGKSKDGGRLRARYYDDM